MHRGRLGGRGSVVAVALLLTLVACTSSGVRSTGTNPGESSAPATASPTLTAPPNASPTPTAPATASPTPTAPPISVGAWERAPDQASLRAVQLELVAWTGTRFVASGVEEDGAVRFLDSRDGRTWNLQPEVWPTGVVWGITAGTHGVVAVGQIDDRAASWYSPDGVQWTVSADDPSLHGAVGWDVRMSDVTETTTGWLAVGSESEPCQEVMCTQAGQGLVWTSADGIRWTQEPASSALADAGMSGVTRGGPGYVAVGGSRVWTSTDGRSWSSVADAPVFRPPPGTDQTFGVSIRAVTMGENGTLVAVGLVLTQGAVGSALAWWSSDGRTWSAATGDRFLNGQLTDATRTPTGLLAVGGSGADSCLGGIWSSADGRSWTCVADDSAFTGFAAYAAAASADVEVVVGFGQPYTLPDSGASSAVVWTRSVG